MDRAGWHYPSGGIRVSDADRDQALSELRAALQAGRITADEFDERADQALSARTGNDLSVLLADLPVESAVAPATVPEKSDPLLATRVAIGASAVAAGLFALAAAGAALSQGPSIQQQELIREQMKSQGVLPPNFPLSPGVNWVGVLAPGVIAALFVLVVVVLSVRLARAHHS